MKVGLLAAAHKVHTWRWANGLTRQGVEVVLFSDTPAPEHLVYQDVKIIQPDWTLWKKLMVFKLKGGPLANNKEKWRAYQALIEKEKPDFLHAHEALSYGPTLAHFPSYRRILTPWGPDMELLSSQQDDKKHLVKQAVESADIITTNAPGLEKHWANLSGEPMEKFQLFSWGVDIDTFNLRPKPEQRAILKSLSIPDEKPILLSPRLAKPLYQILELINAWKGVSVPGHLVILRAGSDDDTYWSEIQHQASKLKNITLVEEYLTQEEMASLYTACKRVVMIPKTDLLASSLLEAMGCGCLPLVNNNPCYQQVMTNQQSLPGEKGIGIFSNLSNLTTNIESCLNMDPKDFAKANHQYITENHQEEKQILKMIRDVYQSLS